MTWVWIVVVLVVLLALGALGAVALLRRRIRRSFAVQAEQRDRFPQWAQEHEYTYSPEFPEEDAPRLEGLGALRPFSDFALARAEHVFRAQRRGKLRYVLQLSILADPGPEARPVTAMTAAVAELTRPGGPSEAEAHEPAASSGEASLHVRGRWAVASVSGPLTLESLEAAHHRLRSYLVQR